MPRSKHFDKKTATTYSLVYRSQNDPLIHDDDAPSQLLTEISGPSRPAKRGKPQTRGDLEAEFGLSGDIRHNEGEAAEHGVYLDDSSYDYMQHLRDLGSSSEATWVAAPKQQGKQRTSSHKALEVTLRDIVLDDRSDVPAASNVKDSYTRKGKAKSHSYQNQQDVPDEIAGFQPDMDPRLREVLEALDDEAYMDNEDDLFAELAAGEEVTIDEFEITSLEADEDENGWESDDTTKPVHEFKAAKESSNLPKPDRVTASTDGEWLESFARSKDVAGSLPGVGECKLRNASKPFDLQSSSASTSSSQFTRRKKRKGALTSSTGFSMTSSALARTEPLTILDAKFDKLAETYMNDGEYDEDFDDTASQTTTSTARTGFSAISKFQTISSAAEVPELVPVHFDGVMDDFLGSLQARVGQRGKKVGRGNGYGLQTGMQQLDDIRNGLGRARLKTPKEHLQRV